MTNHYSLMVPEARSKDSIINVTAPYDGALIATVDTADEEVVDLALETASALYKDRNSWLSIAERIALLERTASTGSQFRA